MPNDFDWFGLAAAITYAHVEAQGYKVSASTSPASGARPATLVGEGEGSVASPSFELPTAEDSSSALCIDAEVGKAGVNHPSSSPLKVHDGGTIERLIADTERICNGNRQD